MSCNAKLVRKRVKERRVVSYTCDRCQRVLPVTDWIEMQEMLHWRMTGGYGSVFGDGCHISLDLCQSCTKEVLGQFVQVNDRDE